MCAFFRRDSSSKTEWVFRFDPDGRARTFDLGWNTQWVTTLRRPDLSPNISASSDPISTCGLWTAFPYMIYAVETSVSGSFLNEGNWVDIATHQNKFLRAVILINFIFWHVGERRVNKRLSHFIDDKVYFGLLWFSNEIKNRKTTDFLFADQGMWYNS